MINIKKGYIIHETTKNSFQLCKILKEYNCIEDAKIDLIKLLAGNTSEKKLIKENDNK